MAASALRQQTASPGKFTILSVEVALKPDVSLPDQDSAPGRIRNLT
jgi:hypothetical protein